MSKKGFFTVNESKNFVHLVVHFMKWTVDFLSISRNGQIFCPFHEMDSWVVHFMKWTISHLGRNIYIYNYTSGAVFSNIPILVLVLTLVVYHFNHMPDFISITVSTILALKSSCRINILLNY